MSNSERRNNLPDIIRTVEPTFNELAKLHNVPGFTFAREAAFAIQILNDNSYLAEVACGNPESLKQAVINVAAIGLSLSPIHKQAYLVPRKGRVCLDISYQGFKDLATSRGAILSTKAVLVCEKDEFEYLGEFTQPRHKMDPFINRGEIRGGYCIANLPTGAVMVDFMSLGEIYNIRDRSEGYKAYVDKKAKTTVWVTDEREMIKKTLIRRAYKSWPKTIAREVLDRALSVVNETDGVDFQAEAIAAPKDNPYKAEGLAIIRDLLEALDKEESAFVERACKAHNRKITCLEDLVDLEITQSVTFLQGLVDERTSKFEKLKLKERSRENAG